MFKISQIFHCKITQLIGRIIKSIFSVSFIKHKGLRKIAFLFGALNGILMILFLIKTGNSDNYNYFWLIAIILPLISFLGLWYESLLVFAGLKLLWKIINWVLSSFSDDLWFKVLKSYLTATYIKNTGVKRICITIGACLSLLLFFDILIHNGLKYFIHNVNFFHVAICMLILFYIPFTLVCVINWILDGFKKNKNP